MDRGARREARRPRRSRGRSAGSRDGGPRRRRTRGPGAGGGSDRSFGDGSTIVRSGQTSVREISLTSNGRSCDDPNVSSTRVFRPMIGRLRAPPGDECHTPVVCSLESGQHASEHRNPKPVNQESKHMAAVTIIRSPQAPDGTHDPPAPPGGTSRLPAPAGHRRADRDGARARDGAGGCRARGLHPRSSRAPPGLLAAPRSSARATRSGRSRSGSRRARIHARWSTRSSRPATASRSCRVSASSGAVSRSERLRAGYPGSQ